MKIKRAYKILVISSALLLAGMPALNAAPNSQTYSGVDDQVVSITPFKDSMIVTAEYQGDTNFIVYPVDGTGKRGFSWFNEIDSWSGQIFQGSSSKPWVAFQVKTQGDWSITIAPLSSAQVINPKSHSGSGAQVFKFNVIPKGLRKLSITHDGDSNFFVRPISNKGKQGFSMVNEIGAYDGTVLLPSNTAYLSIVGDGNWTIALK